MIVSPSIQEIHRGDFSPCICCGQHLNRRQSSKSSTTSHMGLRGKDAKLFSLLSEVPCISDFFLFSAADMK